MPSPPMLSEEAVQHLHRAFSTAQLYMDKTAAAATLLVAALNLAYGDDLYDIIAYNATLADASPTSDPRRTTLQPEEIEVQKPPPMQEREATRKMEIDEQTLRKRKGEPERGTLSPYKRAKAS
ncbi:hypothetical protein BU24DRAFT_469117 [Aaosphaeria arxii CBS 175.79]|uniref:Uncharacterized protein n=1 Tax=Aaosphaeria arxii CBS 175.79 TaxID=1450172 RepID=A0A6A5X5S8_9PLEO|nr:uncharacterized protein BU24DRAFT_469117 [Aaosphaeria arxii CBS 175.79]KAF2008246.1 hypothetical protein BU24DRAFT_469117 [Aaosphaeria arxii CBS 175.79]